MASTTFTLSEKEVIGEPKRSQIHEALSLIAMAHGLALNVQVVEPSLTYKIRQDPYDFNPRVEQDNIGVMYCEHKRYTLGDKDADKPTLKLAYIDLDGYFLHLEGSNSDDTDDPPEGLWMYADVLQILEAEAASHDEDDPDWRRAMEAVDKLAAELPYEKTRLVLKPNILAAESLYLYNHSGLTISHSSFSCKWDSGCIGWHYITKEAAAENWPSLQGEELEAVAMRCLKAELREYDMYLRGEVWTLIIEDEEGELVDIATCYGDSLDECGFLTLFSDEHQAGVTAAWNSRFEQ